MRNGHGPITKWSDDDDNTIRRCATLGPDHIARLLERTPGAVRNRAGGLRVRLGQRAGLTSVRHVEVTPDVARSHILSAVEPDPFGGCWLWARLGMRGNYGRIGLAGYKGSAHRASYRAFVGEIPDGMNVLHKCDVPACVNPAHLFLGTSADNSADMMSKGRAAVRVGEKNTQARLTASDVRYIRRAVAMGVRQTEIAAAYGISAATVCDIKHGRSWAHVEERP